ncbi:MAG: hypothetical protein HQM14_15550 [SAR324 cluster bacterium]|nr:hypothetical protein [SAR324 cluster bacterium]
MRPYSLEYIQILYDISISIGIDVNLQNMTKVALSAYMKKLNCMAGGVYQRHLPSNGQIHFDTVCEIPRRARHDKAYQKILTNFLEIHDSQELSNFSTKLPLIETDLNAHYFHIMELPNFGLMVLVKREKLESRIISNLDALNKKLAASCQSCFLNQQHQRQLETEVEESTQELKESLIQLEQQNTTLLAGNRQLEELNYTKEQMMKRLREVYEENLTPLQEMLHAMENESEGRHDLIRQISRNVYHIQEVIQPITSLYLSEQTIRHKRVLLGEDDKKQQIIAKMALRGSGVQLDIVSDLNTGQECLKKRKYDIVCTNEKLIELSQNAIELFPETQIVFMTSDRTYQYLPTLRKYPFLSNIVSRNDEDRMFTLKNMVTTVSKLITKNIFGLEKYLNWGIEVKQHTVENSKERQQLVNQMESYFQDMGVRRPILYKTVAIAEELMMNAIYDAPVDTENNPLYNHLSRTVDIALRPEEQSVFRYACDGILLAISVADPFGALSRETILDYLQSCYDRKETSDAEKGGAGYGVFQIIEMSDLVVINVKPQVRTEVIAILNIAPDKSKRAKTTSLHYFYD